jgi:hypothetical protein
VFVPRYTEAELREVVRYCSRECATRYPRAGRARPGARRVERPPYEQLAAVVAAMGWSAVGRKYGVSDNAVRKWVRGYEREGAGSGEVGAREGAAAGSSAVERE